jgi:tetratricopeptide (TPR) repeat protein
LRSSYSAPPATTDYKGCLYVFGVLILLGAVIATYGLILIPVAIGGAAWIWYRRRQPDSIAAGIIKQSLSADPAVAVHLLNQAIEADPHGVKTLRACAAWFYDHHCWQDAAEAYAGLLTVHSDFEAENRYITCLLAADRPDDAIPRVEHLRTTMPMVESVQTATLGQLATAYLYKGDVGQAMAFISLAPLQKRNLDAALQGCLYLRAVARYMTGDRRRAISDLERLYAVNPSMADVINDKRAMEAGTFELAKPKPYPDWYPIDQRDAALPSDPGTDEPGASASSPEPPSST